MSAIDERVRIDVDERLVGISAIVIAKALDVWSTIGAMGHGVSETNRLVEIVAIELGFGRFGLSKPFETSLVLIGLFVIAVVVTGVEFSAYTADPDGRITPTVVRAFGYGSIAIVWLLATVNNAGLISVPGLY